MKVADYIGRRFVALVVTGFAGRSSLGVARFDCRCDCGNTTVVTGGNLRRVVSCGCYLRQRRYSHNMTRTPIWNTWVAMRQRCNNKNNRNFHNYGGRGITVCDRWNSFPNFFADMGDRPDGMSLDRINNDLGYSPDNCRWATQAQQSQNQRRTVLSLDVAERIRFLYKSGVSLSTVARQIGVERYHAQNVLNGSWAKL